MGNKQLNCMVLVQRQRPTGRGSERAVPSILDLGFAFSVTEKISVFFYGGQGDTHLGYFIPNSNPDCRTDYRKYQERRDGREDHHDSKSQLWKSSREPASPLLRRPYTCTHRSCFQKGKKTLDTGGSIHGFDGGRWPTARRG